MKLFLNKINQLRKNKLCLFILCFLIGFSFSFEAWAWTAPSVEPPNGNRPSPLNVSDTGQAKTGDLFIQGNIVSTDNIKISGNINLGRFSWDNIERGDHAEGDIVNVDEIIGYNDLQLKGDLGADEKIYIDSYTDDGSGVKISFDTGGVERMRVTNDGLKMASSSYINWGITNGESGFGIRNDSGTIQYKNSGGSWATVGGGGTLDDAFDNGKVIDGANSLANSVKIGDGNQSLYLFSDDFGGGITPSISSDYRILNLGVDNSDGGSAVTAVSAYDVNTEGFLTTDMTLLVNAWTGAGFNQVKLNSLTAGGGELVSDNAFTIQTDSGDLVLSPTGDIDADSNNLKGVTALTMTGDLTVDTNTLYVDSNNNRVGIATTTPSYTLEVDGNTNIVGDLTVNGSPLSSGYWTQTGSDIYYNSGNVGIGTTSPDTELDVDGDIAFSGDYGGASAAFAYINGKNTNSGVSATDDVVGKIELWRGSSNYNSSGWRFKAIDTTTDSTTFHDAFYTVPNNSGSNFYIPNGDLTVSGGDITGANSVALDLGESNSNRVVITGAGDNIFLDTNDAAIGSNGATFNIIAYNGGSDSTVNFKTWEASGKTSIDVEGNAVIDGYIQNKGNSIRDSGGNEIFSFDGSGNINNRVDIYSNSGQDVLFSIGSSDTGAELALYDNGGSVKIRGNNDDMLFYTGGDANSKTGANSSNTMTLDQSGNLQIDGNLTISSVSLSEGDNGGNKLLNSDNPFSTTYLAFNPDGGSPNNYLADDEFAITDNTGELSFWYKDGSTTYERMSMDGSGNLTVSGSISSKDKIVYNFSSASGEEYIKLGEMRVRNFRAKVTIVNAIDQGNQSTRSVVMDLWKRDSTAGANWYVTEDSSSDAVDIIITTTTNDANSDTYNDAYVYVKCADYAATKIIMDVYDSSWWTDDYTENLTSGDIVGTEVVNTSTDVPNGNFYFDRVGIGTTSPGNKLTVEANTGSVWEHDSFPTGTFTAELGKNATGYAGSIKLWGYTAGSYSFLRTSSSNFHIDSSSGNYYFNWDDDVRGTNPGVFRMRDGGTNENVHLSTSGDSWLNGGSLGVGKSDPWSVLDVQGSGYIFRILGDGTAGSKDYAFYQNDAYLRLIGMDGNSYKNTIMVWNSGSNRVGIGGDVTPDAKLDVEGEIRAENNTGNIRLTPTGWRDSSRTELLIHTKGDDAAELDLRSNSSMGGWHISKRAGDPGDLRFYTYTGSTSSFTNRVTFEGTGNVGIGVTDPNAKLDVNGNVDIDGNSRTLHFTGTTGPNGFAFSDSNSNGMGLFYRTSPEQLIIENSTSESGTQVIKMGRDGDIYAHAFYYASDRRFKKDIKPLTEFSIKKILSINPVQFKWKTNNVKGLGFIAQDFEKFYPELVETDQYDDDKKTINYVGLIAPLVKTVQEQHSLIEKQEEEIKELREMFEKQAKEIKLIQEKIKK
jgi:hypothetical protein